MDKFIVSQRLVIFSQKFVVVSGIPRLLASGWLNLFKPYPPEADGASCSATERTANF
jgi:hypothetical protein